MLQSSYFARHTHSRHCWMFMSLTHSSRWQSMNRLRIHNPCEVSVECWNFSLRWLNLFVSFRNSMFNCVPRCLLFLFINFTFLLRSTLFPIRSFFVSVLGFFSACARFLVSQFLNSNLRSEKNGYSRYKKSKRTITRLLIDEIYVVF